MLSGLGFLPGTGLLARGASETVDSVLKAGFLCVISDLSTLRRPLVTDSPLFSSEKTAPKPPADVALAGFADSTGISKIGAGPGGGGGGGGGGGAPADGVLLCGGCCDALPAVNAFATSSAGSPLGFQATPEAWCCLM